MIQKILQNDPGGAMGKHQGRVLFLSNVTTHTLVFRKPSLLSYLLLEIANSILYNDSCLLYLLQLLKELLMLVSLLT